MTGLRVTLETSSLIMATLEISSQELGAVTGMGHRRVGSLRKNPLTDHGDHCYFSAGRARERGGGTRERSIDMGAPLRGHGRAIGRPGAPFKSTPERHDHAIHF